jgi:MoxR-like ATPase
MNVTETKRVIKYLPWHQSIMLTGPHGLGKSSMWDQAMQELSVETGIPHQLVDIRLAEREPGDVIGFPRLVSKDRPLKVTVKVWVNGKLEDRESTVWDVMTHDLPVWFPRDPDWHGAILFDELDRSIREVQQSVMELSNDHRLNMVPLPEHCRVGACCNGAPDVYTTLVPCPALLSRFLKVPFNPTTDEFFDYYDQHGGLPVFKSYLTKFQTDLDVPEGIIEPYVVTPNRRAWMKLSDAVKQWGESSINLLKEPDFLMKLASGFIGDTIAVNLSTFIKNDYNIHDPEDILDRWDKKLEDEFSKAPPTDVGYYSKMLVEFAGKHGLTKKRQVNLTKWFLVIPKESAAGFYQLFLNSQRKVCTEWYKADPAIGEYVMKELLAEHK